MSGSKWKSTIYGLFLGAIMSASVINEQKTAFNDIIDGLKNPKSSFDDIPLKITKLKEMKEQGLITDEDFNKKKSELIEKT